MCPELQSVSPLLFSFLPKLNPCHHCIILNINIVILVFKCQQDIKKHLLERFISIHAILIAVFRNGGNKYGITISAVKHIRNCASDSSQTRCFQNVQIKLSKVLQPCHQIPSETTMWNLGKSGMFWLLFDVLFYFAYFDFRMDSVTQFS